MSDGFVRHASHTEKSNLRKAPTLVAIGAVFIGAGCSSVAYVGELFNETLETADQREFILVDSKRYVSGPYGSPEAVAATIDTIRRESEPHLVSSRALKTGRVLSVAPLERFDYRFPNHCGAHHFRLYESDEFVVLRYYLENRNGDDQIWDYVVGPTPFVGAGLWTPYDHTSESTREMPYLHGNGYEDGMGLWRHTYAIGPVTATDKTRQAFLGEAYDDAVHAAQACTNLAQASE